ncbi:hypothetical protein CONPUDRAFT_140220 [Coniophora puteana RWD-64-598 SS2]|uniref:Rhodopsin domain-containing protein n=1 Tax=Coniophora puteana (strain RWD-64-598) TaxID=741705 RepID=A0A5M3M5S6_CONPW|nr:uncharacterized protein CONPUDRAFT_140220 [Coniophora puteana RWD-64-598 SS2]EIW74738.1 hypothetical protein CONPUDRAFT_140220 [Coniophora puteana RWD-64-598 SS2]
MALTMNGIRVAALILSLSSIVATIGRLWIRTSQKRLWWDDAAVGMAMVLQLLQLVFTLIRYNPEDYTNTTMVAAYYMASEAYYGVIWFSRISLLLIIYRLTVRQLERRILMGLCGVFIAIIVLLVFQAIGVCEVNPAWKAELVPQCDLGEGVAITQAITVVLSDFILIAAPIRLVWKVKLTPAQKIRLIAIFCSTAITTIVSLVHMAYLLRVGGLDEIMAGIAEMSVTLIVASLSVLVAFFTHVSDSHHGSSGSGSGSGSGSRPTKSDRTRSTVVFTPPSHTRRRADDVIQVGVDIDLQTFSEDRWKVDRDYDRVSSELPGSTDKIPHAV